MEIIQSQRFGYYPTPGIEQILKDFRDMINWCISKALELKVTSFFKLRKAIYEEWKAKWGYNTQYCYSACQVACSILGSWRRKGRRPVAKRLFISFSSNLVKFNGRVLRVSVKPRQFLEIPLTYGNYQKRCVKLWKEGKCEIGQIILNEHHVIIPFKKEIEPTTTEGTIAFDMNETCLQAVDDKGIAYRFNLSGVRTMHSTYFEKRRRIQRKIRKPSLKGKLLAKYRGREKRKVSDILHKISKRVVETIGKRSSFLRD